MFRGFWVAVALCMALLGADSACGKTMTVRDISGRSVEVPQNPERIVCLGPGTLRIVVYLQASDKVVAVEDLERLNPRGRPYWLAQPHLHGLPSAGPGGPASINQKPNLELILRLNPQVIFVSYMDASLAEEVQKVLKIPVVVLSYGPFASFDDTFFQSVFLAGQVLNREERAVQVEGFIRSAQEDLMRRSHAAKEEPGPRVYMGGLGFRGSLGLESTDQNYPPFDWVRAANAARELETFDKSHIVTHMETLLGLDPDIIFLDGGGIRLVQQAYERRPGVYNVLRAFENGRVHLLHPYNWYLTNIDTALVNGYAIGKVLYGGAFDDVVLEEKADEIYGFLVGAPVHEEMEKDYGPIGALPRFIQGGVDGERRVPKGKKSLRIQ